MMISGLGSVTIRLWSLEHKKLDTHNLRHSSVIQWNKMHLLLAALVLAAPGLSLAWTPGNGVQPHIVVILADDLGNKTNFKSNFSRKVLFTKLCFFTGIIKKPLGYDDVGWRNSNLDTPNIDNLASNGVIFNRQDLK